MMQPRVPQAARSRLLAQLTNISLPTDLSPEQACAAFDLVDALRDRLWLLYGPQIQQSMQQECPSTPARQADDIHDGEPPF
jgi:hypothetical protein